MRTTWVDNAKAIGIFLVVLGHTKGLEASCKYLIYTFHMPLFFFLAGFLLKEKYLEGTFRSFILRNIKRLIVPYVSFWVISYLYWLPTHSLQSELEQSPGLSLFDPFIGLLLGVGQSLYINGVLWFFPCLFCTAISFYWISKVRHKRVMLLIIAFLGVLGPSIYQYTNVRLPWNLELSFVAAVFYGLGYVISKYENEISQAVNPYKLRFLAVVALCGILILTVKLNGSVNMNRMQFGNLALFYLGAFVGIAVTILLSQIIPRNMFSEWLSTNAIVIYPLHTRIFSAFTGIGVVVFGLNYSFKENLLFSALYIIGAFAICLPASYILRSFFPWTIGRASTSSNKLRIRLTGSHQSAERLRA